jgi:hypothetical protein
MAKAKAACGQRGRTPTGLATTAAAAKNTNGVTALDQRDRTPTGSEKMAIRVAMTVATAMNPMVATATMAVVAAKNTNGVTTHDQHCQRGLTPTGPEKTAIRAVATATTVAMVVSAKNTNGVAARDQRDRTPTGPEKRPIRAAATVATAMTVATAAAAAAKGAKNESGAAVAVLRREAQGRKGASPRPTPRMEKGPPSGAARSRRGSRKRARASAASFK